MGDKINHTDINAGALCVPGTLRMAYTLNETQPVSCSYVSSQPYFYMDEELLLEDDELLQYGETLVEGGIGIETLESDIADLKRKITAYERLSSDFTAPETYRMDRFLSNAQDIVCANATRQTSIMESFLKTLTQSRMASALLDHAQAQGFEIKYMSEIQDITINWSEKIVCLNPALDLPLQMLLTLRELRRIWQQGNGAGLSPLSFAPDPAILVNRAQIADLSTAMIRGAWELQLAGEKEAWSYVENSSLSDLGRAFAREAFMDFRTLNNGQASGAVFETWFLSERCRYQDKKLIEAMLADYDGYTFGSEQISETISIELISALGEQPFGKNYLASHAQMILSDPIFADVRDRSNANFLWFIKFERSFHEAEQQLQSQGQDSAPSDLEGQIIHALEDHKNERENSKHTASATQNSGCTAQQQGGSDTTAAANPTENVIFVQF